MNFENAFITYNRYAFRLETLPLYKVKGEWENYQHYLKTGQCLQDDDLTSFISDIERMVKQGKRHIRTRVLPTSVNLYLVFGSQIGYVPQSRVGAELNFITPEEYRGMDNPYALSDFWLFDDNFLLLMKYSPEGEFIEAMECHDEDKIKSAIKLKDQSIKMAKTLSYFLDHYLKGLPGDL